MADEDRKKRTAEERERMRANQEWLYELANRGLKQLGISREELHRRLGLPPPPPAR